MSFEDDIMQEFRSAMNRMRGVLQAAQMFASRRSATPRPLDTRLLDDRMKHEWVRDESRHDPVARGELGALDGPGRLRATAVEGRALGEQATGDLDGLRQLQEFTGAGQLDPNHASQLQPGTATAAQTPTEAGHRTRTPQHSPRGIGS